MHRKILPKMFQIKKLIKKNPKVKIKKGIHRTRLFRKRKRRMKIKNNIKIKINKKNIKTNIKK